MPRLRLLSAAALLVLAANASATSFIVTTDSIVGALEATSDATSFLRDNKVVRAARDDDAFIATDGQWRGTRLELALAYLRRTQPKLHASDLELAQAILVQ